VLEDRRRRLPELVEQDQIVASAVGPIQGIGRAQRALEAMQPTQEGQAQNASPIASEPLVQISLFPPKPRRWGCSPGQTALRQQNARGLAW